MPASSPRVAEAGLLALLTFAVLAFGATAYWARAILVAGSAALFLLWWAGAARSTTPAAFRAGAARPGLELGGVSMAYSGFGLLGGLFLVLVALQLLPLPRAVRALLAPGLTARALGPAEVLGDPALGRAANWAPLAVDPSGVLNSVLLFLAYGALFVVAYNVVDSRQALVRVVRSLVVVAFLVALAGLVQDLAGAEKIYGFKEMRYGGSAFGPFVNHNHFAGYMELTIPLAFGLFLRRLWRPSEPPPSMAVGAPSGPGSSARRMLGGEREVGKRFGQATLLALALAVMLAALLLSLSRGGLLSLAAGAAVVLLLLVVGGHLRRWEVAALVLVGSLALALFLWIGPGEALEHFRQAESLQNEPSLAVRPMVWRGTLDAFLEAPALGSGLGGYPPVFLHHYPTGTQRLWYQAHNDYVQLLAETGLAGGLLAGAALLLLLGRLLGPIVRRARIPERYIFTGLIAGILALLVHSLVDFNLQIPANGAHFVVLCALALAHRRIFRDRKEA